MNFLSGGLFVFEGPDGVGKTTVAAQVQVALAQQLTAPVSVLSFPGRRPSSLGALIYDLHHEPLRYGLDDVRPTALQLLHVAAHIDAIDREIRPRIAKGQIVLLDRYWWSTWVYGVLSGADPNTLRSMIDLERRHWGDIHPEAVFLLRRQVQGISGPDQTEYSQREEEYQALAAQEENVVVLDNATTIDSTVARVLVSINQKLRSRVSLRGPQG